MRFPDHSSSVRRAGSGRSRTCKEMGSRPISRVLSRTVIHLVTASPRPSSNLPEPDAGHAKGFLFGLAPGGVYRATHCCQARGALLPHPFTLTGLPQET